MILDNENGRKHVERMEFDYFVEAYEYFKGERLVPVGVAEPPDFICQRPDGSVIGIELTKVIRDTTETGALDKICERLEKKRGLASEDVILVLQLVDCPITELEYLLDESLKNYFSSYGFVEIWLADSTGIETYGDIELFCLCPKECWGYYQRANPKRKPYG